MLCRCRTLAMGRGGGTGLTCFCFSLGSFDAWGVLPRGAVACGTATGGARGQLLRLARLGSWARYRRFVQARCHCRCHCLCPHGVDVNGLSFQSLPLLVVPVGAPSLPGRSSGSAAAARVFDGPTEVDVKTVSSVARAASRLHAKGVFACVECSWLFSTCIFCPWPLCGTAQGVPPRFYGKRRFAAVAAHLQKLPQYPPARSSAVEGLLSRCRMVLLDGKAGRSTALCVALFFSIAPLHGLW